MQNIGARIRTWREERNLSREDLAEQAGLSVSFLAALEDDGLLPALGPLHKVARALGVRLGTFMDDQVTREPVVTRASEHTGDLTIGRARDADPALRYTALARGKSDRAMEPFLWKWSRARPSRPVPTRVKNFCTFWKAQRGWNTAASLIFCAPATAYTITPSCPTPCGPRAVRPVCWPSFTFPPRPVSP